MILGAVEGAALEKELRRLWPRVDPWSLIFVLRHLTAQGEDARAQVQATLDEALALPPAAAASALMGPVASAAASYERRELKDVVNAIDALIRAGGDPAPALDLLATCMEDYRNLRGAASALRRAALRGWSIAALGDRLATLSPSAGEAAHVRGVQRLALLGRRGMNDALARLDHVYRSHGLANLFEGVGLVEELLLADAADDVDLARRSLIALEEAGADLYRAWIALLPVLRRDLRADDPRLRSTAARALGQLRYTLKESREHPPEEAFRRVEPALAPVLDELAALLASDAPLAADAAETIEVFAALGAPLGGVCGALEAALDDPRVEVRSPCARSLSTYMRRIGEESPLPSGCSHRRTYAASDAPLDDRRAGRCPACGEVAAAVIFERHDRGNTWDDTLLESRCGRCGVYSIERYGY